jgi:hypothetical protein
MFGVAWCFISSSTGGASIQKSDGHYQKKRAALMKKAPSSSFQFQLEVEPQTELHAPRIMGAVQLEEATGCSGNKGVVDAVELRVVKEVECLHAEFKSGPFVDGEPFESAEIEVEACRQIQSVPSDIPEPQPRRNRKGTRVIEEQRIRVAAKGVGIADQVGPIPAGRRAVCYACVIPESASIGYAERKSGLGDGDARNLPTAKEIVGQAGAAEKGAVNRHSL